MVRFCLLFLAVLAAPAMAQQPEGAGGRVEPAAARRILERDWVLMNWALKFYDADRNILLSATEAQRAAAAFRSIADSDKDGRVSTQEYRAARLAILTR